MSLLEDVRRILREALQQIESADTAEALTNIQVRYLGRKGSLTGLLKGLKDLSPDERKSVGAEANGARAELEEHLSRKLEALSHGGPKTSFDPTLPGTARRPGSLHIVNKTIDEICQIFRGMGFEISRGPDVETDYYNFGALNFPPDHPARDMQDTFFVEHDRLLRTHTTPVQARMLEARRPPIKMITPGKCFRNEAISTRAHAAFHQVDGFLVDVGVSMADLKGAIGAFCHAYFGENLQLKWRPSFFPFTEPSAEVDIQCFLCEGKGCQLCKFTGWLEIMGCGMIDPKVLSIAGHDPEVLSGYAFGMGVERIALLRHKINDIRLFFNNDVRFLRQFD